MCLSCPSHTIGEACCIVTLFELRQQGFDCAIEDLLAGLLVVEDLMETKLSVSDSKVIIHEITVVDSEQVLVLRTKGLND